MQTVPRNEEEGCKGISSCIGEREGVSLSLVPHHPCPPVSFLSCCFSGPVAAQVSASSILSCTRSIADLTDSLSYLLLISCSVHSAIGIYINILLHTHPHADALKVPPEGEGDCIRLWKRVCEITASFLLVFFFFYLHFCYTIPELETLNAAGLCSDSGRHYKVRVRVF